MDNTKHRRLQELDDSDFEIVKGEPDIRGWDVKNSAGLKIGEVEELIVDAQLKKVRYMVVDLDDKDLKLPDRKVLIPIGLAELHKEDDDVLLPSVTVDQLGVLPAYDKDHLDEEVEQKLCTALGRTEQIASAITQTESATGNAEHKILETKKSSAEVGSNTAQEGKIEADQNTRKYDASENKSQQPAIGTAEYYGNFYQHSYFNDYNLYKNRQQEKQSQETSGDSDYERGLRLWELRSQGLSASGETPGDETPIREQSEESRKEKVQTRRREYEEQKARKKGSTIIQRINDEGLQEES